MCNKKWDSLEFTLFLSKILFFLQKEPPPPHFHTDMNYKREGEMLVIIFLQFFKNMFLSLYFADNTTWKKTWDLKQTVRNIVDFMIDNKSL